MSDEFENLPKSPCTDAKTSVEIYRRNLKPSENPRIGKVYWAHLNGYPIWPARIATSAERENLEASKPPSRIEKGKILVVFFGIRCDSGWISPANLYDFTPEHISGLLLIAKLDKAHSYRQAMIEAIQLTMAEGAVYPQQIVDMLEEANREEKRKDKVPTEILICPACHGTAVSGVFFYCGECQESAIHTHCLPCQRRENGSLGLQGSEPTPDTRWICKVCSAGFGFSTDTYLPVPPMKAFFGTVVGYLPPSLHISLRRSSREITDQQVQQFISSSPSVPVVSKEGDQLYHIAWDDGDQQDYEEFEYQAARLLAEKLGASSSPISPAKLMSAPLPSTEEEENRWGRHHSSVGSRVAAYFHFEDEGEDDLEVDFEIPAFGGWWTTSIPYQKRFKSARGKKARKKIVVNVNREKSYQVPIVMSENSSSSTELDSKKTRKKRVTFEDSGVASSSSSSSSSALQFSSNSFTESAESMKRTRGRPRKLMKSEVITTRAADSPSDCTSNDGSSVDRSPYHDEERTLAELAQRALAALVVCQSEVESLKRGRVNLSLEDRRAAYRCIVNKCVTALDELDF